MQRHTIYKKGAWCKAHSTFLYPGTGLRSFAKTSVLDGEVASDKRSIISAFAATREPSKKRVTSDPKLGALGPSSSQLPWIRCGGSQWKGLSVMDARKLLWVDGLAGAFVGVVVLSISRWLSGWYRLPHDLVFFMGVMNLVYAGYSLSLASRKRRPMALIVLLVFANLGWAVACVRWGLIFAPSASWLGLVQLWGEALFVGGLAALEWRWREQLQTA